MPDLSAKFKIDWTEVNGAFADISKLKNAVAGSGTALNSQVSSARRASREFSSLGKNAREAGTHLSRARERARSFAAALVVVGRAGEVIGGISTGVSVLTNLYGRLKKRGPAAMKSTEKAAKGTAAATKTATVSTNSFFTMLSRGALKAGLAATAIWGVTRAWKALANTKQPNLKIPGAGGGGGFSLGKALPGIAAVAGIGLFAGGIFGQLKSGVSDALQGAAKEEQLQISFEVLTGGLEPAKKALADIRELSERTPLKFGDVAGAGRSLLAFGETAETLPGVLKRIGDVSTGIQAPIGDIAEIYGKARVQGTLFAEDINQLTGRGINVLSQFADMLGRPVSEVKKLASEGQITFPYLEEAFRRLTDEGGQFAGMMERQSKTVAGLWSTLLDRIQLALVEFGKPINDALRPLLEKAVELAGILKERAAGVGEALASAVDHIRAVFQVLANENTLEVLGKALQLAFQTGVDTLIRGVSTAIELLKSSDFMEQIKGAFSDIGHALEISILSAVENIYRAMSNLPAVGEQFEMVANAVRMSRYQVEFDQDQEQRRRAAKDSESESIIDLARRIYEEAEGIFGESNEGLLADLRPILDEIKRQAEENRQARTKEEEGGEGGRGGGGEDDGLIPSGAASGGGVVGAFQRAVNLVQGRTVNELVAVEAKKTNELLNAVRGHSEKTQSATEQTAKNTSKGAKVEVKVVPTFADS